MFGSDSDHSGVSLFGSGIASDPDKSELRREFGSAGIQADLKAFAAAGCHGMSAIVALTAQNTVGVTAVHEVPADFVTAQLDAVFDDFDVRGEAGARENALEEIMTEQSILRDPAGESCLKGIDVVDAFADE